MIYEYPASDAPIQQGDIFRAIPRIEVNLAEMPIVANDHTVVDDWLAACAVAKHINALVGIRPVLAIVVSQCCDAIRVDDIAMCEVDGFDVVEPLSRDAKKPKSTMSLITKHARVNQKWFYLPPDPKMGFHSKMAVDFRSVLRVSRLYLENNIGKLRIGTLNEVAREHFRERLSEFFRRYPYDEWYPLDKAELQEYTRDKPEPIDPYPWQK